MPPRETTKRLLKCCSGFSVAETMPLTPLIRSDYSRTGETAAKFRHEIMTKLMNPMSVLALLITPLFLIGCGESLPPGMPALHPITLTFTQSGNPLDGAAVQLIPLDAASKWVSGGGTDARGIITPKTHGTYPGVPAGKYKLCVTKTETEGELGEVDMSNPSESSESTLQTTSLVDEQYRLPTTTPLEIEVTGSNDQFPAFELGAPVRTVQARPPM